MPLTFKFPIRNILPHKATPKIARGQLYNIDDNEFFNFQFNCSPETLREFNWADDQWLGREETHSQFLGSGQTQFELPLQFLVAPGAPIVENNCNPSLSETSNNPKYPASLLIIENVIAAINRWTAIRPDKRRPSLIRVILGDRSFDGRIVLIGIRDDDRFANGRLRRATIRIGFKEWRSHK
ncbi:hypothetical protein M0R72_07840 [Candidatus Pacearchaeota archaeon]|jgi:hypothetical protein|nr:hypothetical protein [Candidatus Pacearchaeota archaeon]